MTMYTHELVTIEINCMLGVTTEKENRYEITCDRRHNSYPSPPPSPQISSEEEKIGKTGQENGYHRNDVS
jgi:hypothetical protein